MSRLHFGTRERLRQTNRKNAPSLRFQRVPKENKHKIFLVSNFNDYTLNISSPSYRERCNALRVIHQRPSQNDKYERLPAKVVQSPNNATK